MLFNVNLRTLNCTLSALFNAQFNNLLICGDKVHRELHSNCANDGADKYMRRLVIRNDGNIDLLNSTLNCTSMCRSMGH